MPWNVSKTAGITGKEILRFPAGLTAVKSVVLDATDVGSWPDPNAADTRFLVPAGTILQVSATNPDKYVKFKGTPNVAAGILKSPIDMYANATESNEPAAMFFHECVFATEAIVDFTLYATNLAADLTTCKFA